MYPLLAERPRFFGCNIKGEVTVFPRNSKRLDIGTKWWDLDALAATNTCQDAFSCNATYEHEHQTQQGRMQALLEKNQFIWKGMISTRHDFAHDFNDAKLELFEDVLFFHDVAAVVAP